MQITDLNTTESKQLLLVHSRLHYDNINSVENIYNYVEKNDCFKSQPGILYKKALHDFIHGYNPISCIYCDNELSEDHYLICKSCTNSLINMVVRDMNENPGNRKEKRAVKELTKKEALTANDYLEEPEKLHKKTIIAIIIAVIILAALVIGVGFLVSHYLSQKDNNSVNTLGSASTDILVVDGFDLLGKKYEDVELSLGTPEDVIDASTKYFAASGISLIIDSSTGRVIYIDNDGSGDGSTIVPIFGVYPGLKGDNARAIFTGKGIDVVDYSGDSFMCLFQIKDDLELTYEIDVTLDNSGKVIFVAARIV